MPSQVISWQVIQIDFAALGTKSEFIKVCFYKIRANNSLLICICNMLYLGHRWGNRQSLQHVKASVSLKDFLFYFYSYSYFLVKINGAEDESKRRTVNMKYFVISSKSKKNQRLMNVDNVDMVITNF